MAEFDVSTGLDTWVSQTNAAQNNAAGRFPALKGGASDQFQTFLSMPLTLSAIAGRTILSATLSVPAQGNWISQTISVQACAASWNVSTLKWSNRPAVTGSVASSGSTGALAPGARFDIDFTALVQAIADGQPNYGWRLTTSQTSTRSTVRGFDSGLASWRLHVEVSDLLSKPTQLAPSGVIGVAKPVLLFDDLESLSAVQVQIDTAANAASVDFDSGWVAVTRPQLALSSTAYAGLADGDTTYWRARLKTVNGSISAWSDWQDITRHDKPTIVMDNPSGADLWDPTPTIAAHLSPAGDADTRWQVIVQAVGDPTDVRYNSGDHLDGADLEHTIPLRWKGRKVFPTDGDYVLLVKAWDRSDRVPSPFDPTFTYQKITVTLDVDGAVTAPTLSVSLAEDDGGFPRPRLHIERGSDPDWFVVLRDGEYLTTVDVDDFRTAPGEWDWDDESAPPNTTSTYRVRAVTEVSGVKKQSASSSAESILNTVLGVWLRSDLGNVVLDGTPEAALMERRQTFDLPYSPHPVDIVTAIGGLEGSFKGTIDRRQEDLEASVEMLLALREIPTAEIQLVWGTVNAWVNLRALTVTPAADALLPSAPLYDVAFGFYEIDPLD